MSDLFDTPRPAQTAPTTTYDRPGFEPTSADVPAAHAPMFGNLRIEEPRRHPLTYAALGLAILGLLLSIIALARPSGNDVRPLRVGNNDCVSVAQDTGPAALYCRTGGLPGK